MAVTENYGMKLYAESDDFKITGSEDSLNHNFEVIDKEIANAKAVGDEIKKIDERLGFVEESIEKKANGAGITFSINEAGGLTVTYESEE